MALRISSTCSPVITPAAWAAATAGSTGGNGWPTRLVRAARSAASCSRRALRPSTAATGSAGRRSRIWRPSGRVSSRPAAGPAADATGPAAGMPASGSRRSSSPVRAGQRFHVAGIQGVVGGAQFAIASRTAAADMIRTYIRTPTSPFQPDPSLNSNGQKEFGEFSRRLRSRSSDEPRTRSTRTSITTRRGLTRGVR